MVLYLQIYIAIDIMDAAANRNHAFEQYVKYMP